MRNSASTVLAVVLLLRNASAAWAADISISLSIVARDDQVRVSVSNTERDPTTNLSLNVELDGYLRGGLCLPFLPLFAVFFNKDEE